MFLPFGRRDTLDGRCKTVANAGAAMPEHRPTMARVRGVRQTPNPIPGAIGGQN